MFSNGYCAPEFASVRIEFERNFARRNEKGAGCCVYFQGRKVVDLWGGERAVGSSWGAETLALTFSVTKGMAAAALVVAHSRGLFELDAPVASYWPDFGQGGKEQITVRQLLNHEAGLISVDQPLTLELLASPEKLGEVMARQKPAWLPGARHGYHTLTLGWYQSEFLRRVDPQRRTIGQFFRDEIALPLEVEFHIGLPADIADEELAVTEGFHRLALLRHLGAMPPAMVLAGIWPTSLVARSVTHWQFSLQGVGDSGCQRLWAGAGDRQDL
jgi:CubicO group peptidase (beta-lactamase class C family)